MSAARSHDPLGDDVDDLATFDHNHPLLADTLRPPRHVGAAPIRHYNLAEQATQPLDGTYRTDDMPTAPRGRHRPRRRRFDWVIAGFYTWAVIDVALAIALSAALVFAFQQRHDLTATGWVGVFAFIAVTTALMTAGLVNLIVLRDRGNTYGALAAEVHNMGAELARYRLENRLHRELLAKVGIYPAEREDT